MTSSVYTVAFVASLAKLICLVPALGNGDCNDGELEGFVYCSSSEKDAGNTVSCPVQGISGVTNITNWTMDQNNNTDACTGNNYGKFGLDRVYVQNGCDAVFIVCGKNTATTISITEIVSKTPTSAQTSSAKGTLSTDQADFSTTSPLSMFHYMTTNHVLTTNTTQLTTMTATATTGALTTDTTHLTTQSSLDVTPKIFTDATSTSKNGTTAPTLTPTDQGLSDEATTTMSTGAIAGIVSGGLLLVVLIIVLFVYTLKSQINSCNVASSEGV